MTSSVMTTMTTGTTTEARPPSIEGGAASGPPPRRFALITDSAWATGGNLAGVLGSILSVAIVARATGLEGTAWFGVALAIAAVGNTVLDLGVAAAAVRFASPLVRRDPRRAAEVLAAAAWLKLGASLLAIVLGVPLAVTIARAVGGSPTAPLAYGAGVASAACACCVSLGLTVLQAHGRFRPFALLVALPRILLPLFLLAVFVAGRLDVGAALLVQLAAAGVGAVVALGHTRRVTAGVRIGAGDRIRLLRFGGWLFVSTAAQAVLEQAGVLILVSFGAVGAGAFAAAARLAMPVSNFNACVLQVLQPHVARLAPGGEVVRYLRRIVLASGGIALVVSASAVLFAPFGVSLVLGPGFEEAVPLLRVLVPTTAFLLVVSSMVAAVVFSAGRPRRAALVDLAALLVAVTAYVFVAPRHGALGVVVVYATVRLGAGAIFGLHVWRRMAVRPTSS